MAPPLHAPERFEAVLEARAATASRAIDAIVDLVPPHDYGPAAVGRALRYGAVQRDDVGAIVAEQRVPLSHVTSGSAIFQEVRRAPSPRMAARPSLLKPMGLTAVV
jgi:hypothetical protein